MLFACKKNGVTDELALVSRSLLPRAILKNDGVALEISQHEHIDSFRHQPCESRSCGQILNTSWSSH
jgi:hypothetical protein